MSGKGKITRESGSDAAPPPGPKLRPRASPARSEKGRADAAERERRLAAALRANLHKRKAQASARRLDSSGSRPSAPPRRAKQS